MEYLKVTEPEEAEFWIPEYDLRYRYKGLKRIYKLLQCKLLGEEFNNDVLVTLGKPYKLSISQDDEEYVIIDDLGREITLWNLHAGYFVKEDNT
jgi:hypothetical protein